MRDRHGAAHDAEADWDPPTDRIALPGRAATQPRRRWLVISLTCGLLLAIGLVLVGLAVRGGDLQLADAAAPAAPPTSLTADPAAAAPAALPPTPASQVTSDPCPDAAAFRQVLEANSPGFSARRSLTNYRHLGCSRGTALAQGSKPESDSTFVALIPQGEGRFKVESWPAGTECTAISTRLPKTLASKFCATPEPAAPAPAPRSDTTTGHCSPDLPTCPAGYTEGVTNKSNPYGCNFDAINADNPCQYRLTTDGKHNPTTPASRWAACHLNGIREFC